MKSINNRYYVELKDKRYITQPTEKIKLKEHKKPEQLRNQNQAIIETQIERTEKVFKNQNEGWEVKSHPKTNNKRSY